MSSVVLLMVLFSIIMITATRINYNQQKRREKEIVPVFLFAEAFCACFRNLFEILHSCHQRHYSGAIP